MSGKTARRARQKMAKETGAASPRIVPFTPDQLCAGTPLSAGLSIEDMPAGFQMLYAVADTGDIVEWEGERIVVVKDDDLVVKNTDDTPTALLKYLTAHRMNPDEPLSIPTEVFLRGYSKTRILTPHGTYME